MNKKIYLGKIFKDYIPNQVNKGLHYFVIVGVSKKCFLVSQGTSVYLTWNNEENNFFKEQGLAYYSPDYYDEHKKIYIENKKNETFLLKILRHKTVFCAEKGEVFFKNNFLIEKNKNIFNPNYLGNLDFLDDQDLIKLIKKIKKDKIDQIPLRTTNKTKQSKGFAKRGNNLFKGFKNKKALDILQDSLDALN